MNRLYILFQLASLLTSASAACHSGQSQKIQSLKELAIDESALEGHNITQFTITKSTDSCFKRCVADCTCVSFNEEKDGTNCEINIETNITSPGSLKPRAGYKYQPISMELSPCTPQNCDQSVCCLFEPCQNNGICTNECHDEWRRLSCACASGYAGSLCQTRLPPCESQPCLNGGNCTAIGNDFNCSCPTGFSGVICEFDYDGTSCLNVLEEGRSHGNGIYKMKFPDHSKRNIYCLMDAPGDCGGDGWAIAIKADGQQQNFKYDASTWLANGFNQAPGIVGGLDNVQFKSYAVFVLTSFDQICLGMKTNNVTRWMVINKKASSLKSIFKDSVPTFLPISRDSFISLIPSSTLQPNCNRVGFNVVCGALSTRIGILTNGEDDCRSCDSMIGIGVTAKGDIGSCGYYYGSSRQTAAFCYVLVR